MRATIHFQIAEESAADDLITFLPDHLKDEYSDGYGDKFEPIGKPFMKFCDRLLLFSCPGQDDFIRIEKKIASPLGHEQKPAWQDRRSELKASQNISSGIRNNLEK